MSKNTRVAIRGVSLLVFCRFGTLQSRVAVAVQLGDDEAAHVASPRVCQSVWTKKVSVIPGLSIANLTVSYLFHFHVCEICINVLLTNLGWIVSTKSICIRCLVPWQVRASVEVRLIHVFPVDLSEYICWCWFMPELAKFWHLLAGVLLALHGSVPSLHILFQYQLETFLPPVLMF